VNCFAHARRKFYEIAESAPATRIFAHEAVEKIDALFADERAWKSLDGQARYQQRQAIAVPKLAALKTMLADKMVGMGDSAATAKAIAYLFKRWGNFTRYTERGDLSISNHAAERALRKAALGRNNFLFVGNERGGEAAAIYYSLIESLCLRQLWLCRPEQTFAHRGAHEPKCRVRLDATRSRCTLGLALLCQNGRYLSIILRACWQLGRSMTPVGGALNPLQQASEA
jgi:hypothetical protein